MNVNRKFSMFINYKSNFPSSPFDIIVIIFIVSPC